MILIRTHIDYQQMFPCKDIPENIIVIDSYEVQNELILEKLHCQYCITKNSQTVG